MIADISEFHAKASEVMQQLEIMVLNADINGVLDIENSGDVLEISKDEVVYLVSKRVASRQIWIASPVSGALKFDYQSLKWLDKEGREIYLTFRSELAKLFGLEFK